MLNSVSALDVEPKRIFAGNGDKKRGDYVEITIPVPKIHNSTNNSSIKNNNNELQIISNNTTSVNRILVNGPNKSTITATSTNQQV